MKGCEIFLRLLYVIWAFSKRSLNFDNEILRKVVSTPLEKYLESILADTLHNILLYFASLL
jgi:hypothetical protein